MTLEELEQIISEKIIEELDYALENIGANHSIIGVEFVDIENQEITIKFSYNVIPEDGAITLTSY